MVIIRHTSLMSWDGFSEDFDDRVGHGATEHDIRILMYVWPPEIWNAAHALGMAERDVLEVKIPAAGRSVI
jgi:hypothetical protein